MEGSVVVAGTKPSETPPPVKGRIPIPADLGTQIFNLSAKMRPGMRLNRPQFDAGMDSYFGGAGKAGQGMTKDDFARLLGLDRTGGVTDLFWRLFTGGKSNHVIKTKEEFLDCLQNVDESLDMTGGTLVSLAASNNIIPINIDRAVQMVRGMGLTLQDLGNNYYLRQIFERAKALDKQYGDNGKEGFEGLSEKGWRLLTFGLLHDFAISSAWKELGYGDIKKLDLFDPWVVERFGDMFEKYVKQDIRPSKDQLNALIKFQERVKDFRAWAKERGISQRVNLSPFNPKAKNDQGKYALDEIIENYEKLGTDGVLKILDDPRYRRTLPMGEGTEISLLFRPHFSMAMG